MWARFKRWVKIAFIENPQTELEKYIATKNVKTNADLEYYTREFQSMQLLRKDCRYY